MICLSVAEPTYDCCAALIAAHEPELLEIRLDGTSVEEMQRIFSLPTAKIATCRPGAGKTDTQRAELLEKAIDAGAAYVDVEIENDTAFKQRIVERARQTDCKVILSYHNFKLTPRAGELKEIMRWCFAEGADIAKIACMVNNKRDCARILSLYTFEALRDFREPDRELRILVLGMGDMGKITRIAAPLLGAPFTYVSAAVGQETAAGQLDVRTLRDIQRLMG